MQRAGDDGAAMAMLRALAGRSGLDDAMLGEALGSLPYPAALLDREARVVRVTEAATARTGLLPGDDWFGRTATPDSAARLRQGYAEAQRSPGAPFEHLQRLGEEGYSRIAWHYVVRPVDGAGGGALVFGAFRSDPPWDAAAVLQLAGDAIFIADPTGRFAMVNEQACALVGYSRGALLGLEFVALLDPESLQEDPLQVVELQSRRKVVVERVVVHRDGSKIPIEVGATLLPGGYVQAIVRDLRPRRAAAEALRRSEAILRAVTEHLPDIVVVHREGRVVYVNPAAARAWDKGDANDLVGRPILDLVHPDERAVVAARVRAMMTTNSPMGVQLERLIRRDGSTLLAEVAALPVEFDGHRCVMAVARDVTETMAMRARLSQADRMASVGLLAAGVAHEINNPLTYVLLNLERLSAALTEAGYFAWAGWAAEAREGASRVQKIVRDLRSFARADESESGPIEVGPVIDAALQLAANALRFRARVQRDDGPGPAPKVLANEGRLLQVFVNLLVNASHAVGEGDPEGNVVHIETRVVDGKVRVAVRDTGRGIPAEHLPRLFEPFFTTKPVGEGSGLGLWISHNIVTSYGGSIEVESVVGQGSTFAVVLPCVAEVGEGRSAQGVDAAAAEPPPSGGKGPGQGPGGGPEDGPGGRSGGGSGPRTGRRPRVLVVDDEPMILLSLGALLATQYEVVTVGSGEAARATLRDDRRFDVILCDLMMAEVTGMDLYRGLVPVDPALAGRMVFMTGGAFTEGAERFLAEVSNPRVVKPFEYPALVALIDQLAARAEVEDPPLSSSPRER